MQYGLHVLRYILFPVDTELPTRKQILNKRCYENRSSVTIMC
jgi:hypothetical protein